MTAKAKPSTVVIDNRKVAVAVRLAKFAAQMNRPATSCPYTDGADAEEVALRRVWLATYLRLRPPKAGAVTYGASRKTGANTGAGKVAATASPRELSADELASGVDFAQIQADYADAVAALAAAFPAIAAAITAALVADLTAALASVGAVVLTADTAAVAALGDLIAGHAVTLATRSAQRAAAELAGIGLPADDVDVDEAALSDLAQATAHLIASGLANAAARVALLRDGPGVDPTTVTDAVQADLDALVADERGWVTGSLSSCMSAAQHAGRMAAFQAMADAHGADAAVWVASEVNGLSRCKPCAEIDGTRFDTFDEAVAAYPTGRYVGCLGRDRCRGVLFAVAS